MQELGVGAQMVNLVCGRRRQIRVQLVGLASIASFGRKLVKHDLTQLRKLCQGLIWTENRR